MRINREIERLNKRQTVYEERMEKFAKALSRRNKLVERAKTLGVACEWAGVEGVILQQSKHGYSTEARISVDSWHEEECRDEKIRNDTSLRVGIYIVVRSEADQTTIHLPCADDMEKVAKHHAKEGYRYITPMAVANRALSVYSAGRTLDKFGDAMDMLETAAMDPALNFELSGTYADLSSAQDLSPSDFIER